jgi:hypothetical protein
LWDVPTTLKRFYGFVHSCSYSKHKGKKNNRSGFYKTGIWPINPNVVTGDITVIRQCHVHEIAENDES